MKTRATIQYLVNASLLILALNMVCVTRLLADCAAENGVGLEADLPKCILQEGTLAIEYGDYQRAYDLLLPYAESGNAEAQFSIGLLVGWGFGEETSRSSISSREKASLEWLFRAAANGHRKAAKLVSKAYAEGWGRMSVDNGLSRCWALVSRGVEKPKNCTQQASRSEGH